MRWRYLINIDFYLAFIEEKINKKDCEKKNEE